MDLVTMHYLLWLRPLVVFLAAGPFIALVVLCRWYQERRRERRAGRVERSTRFARVGRSPEARRRSEAANDADVARMAVASTGAGAHASPKPF